MSGSFLILMCGGAKIQDAASANWESEKKGKEERFHKRQDSNCEIQVTNCEMGRLVKLWEMEMKVTKVLKMFAKAPIHTNSTLCKWQVLGKAHFCLKHWCNILLRAEMRLYCAFESIPKSNCRVNVLQVLQDSFVEWTDGKYSECECIASIPSVNLWQVLQKWTHCKYWKSERMASITRVNALQEWMYCREK